MDDQGRDAASDVTEFLAGVPEGTRRHDAQALLEMMTRRTGEPAAMWGTSIIGFGTSHYIYQSGREGDQPCVGFSPRKEILALYGLLNAERARPEPVRLGKHKTGVGCLYINKLSDVDAVVLESLISHGYAHMKAASM